MAPGREVVEREPPQVADGVGPEEAAAQAGTRRVNLVDDGNVHEVEVVF
jgi:hypothetical protein